MARFGGIAFPLAVAIAGLLVAYLALFPALFALALHTLVRRRPVVALARAGGLGGDRVRTAGDLRRLSLGAAGLQPGDGAARRAAGKRHRRVRAVGAAGAASATALAWPVRDGRVAPVDGSGRRGGASSPPSRSGGSQRVAASDLTAAGRPLRVGHRPGQRRPGHEVGSARAQMKSSRGTCGSPSRWPIRARAWCCGPSPPRRSTSSTAPSRRSCASWRAARGVQLLVGSDQWEQATPPASTTRRFSINADGTTGGVYRKVHLVPFGEYVPLKRAAVFRQARWSKRCRTSRRAPRSTRCRSTGGPVSTAICYEVVYPGLIREGMLNGSALLTTITNDAWFGRSSAPSQHFAMAAMRAGRAGPVSRSGRQHRDQRRRRPLRAGRCCRAACSWRAPGRPTCG